MKIIIYFFLFFLSFDVNSVDLTDQISSFFKKEYPLNKNDITIIVRTPLKKNMHCKNPFFSFSNNIRSLSLIDILLTCGVQNQHLKIEVQMKGKYITANKKIFRGAKITESDLKVMIGRLDVLPKNTYIEKKDVVDRISLRDIYPLQPITSVMTRPFWLVKINQKVTLIIKGIDFKIISKGTSLLNASKNEIVKVKTNTGEILKGTLNERGEVIIKL